MINTSVDTVNFNIKYWLKFSILNLLIVGSLGVLMRYKIGFEFPYFNQKYIQEAHSHFAFAGWITHTLYILLINFILHKIPTGYYKQYRALIITNLVCAYGMLLSFLIGGYGIISITFSAITIIVACFYAYYFINDLKKITSYNPSTAWFKAALWFNIISSLGTFYLAYIMTSGNFNEYWYLASAYFYLHFQYNGFFIFTCMGLVYSKIQTILPNFKHDKTFFNLFFISFVPAYFLSILWAKIPISLYVIVVIAAFLQVIAWVKFIGRVRKNLTSNINLPKLIQYMFLFVAAAFSVKLLLQLGSTIPEISKLAFGFRPIVIAYLHLVLLAVISVFLILYMQSLKLIHQNKLSIAGIIIFVIGVFLNELFLAIQGIASFSYYSVPMMNESLFVVSLVLLIALILLVLSQTRFSVNEKLN